MLRVVVFAVSLLGVTACKKEPKLGEPCGSEGAAKCASVAEVLSCSGGKWERVACSGPRGCVAEGATVKCDESLATEGQPCGTPQGDHFACAVGGKAELRCEGTTWKLLQACGGPAGCRTQGGRVECDGSVAVVGDLCAREKDAACAKDGKSILECRAGKYEVNRACEEPTRCKLTGTVVKCDG